MSAAGDAKALPLTSIELPPGAGLARAQRGDRAWGARMMAASEPWLTLAQDAGRIAAGLRQPGVELWIAREAGAPAALLALAPRGFAGAPYLKTLAVAPQARGRGWGTRLLRFAEARFARQGRLFLLVSSFNTGAQRLYWRHGYQKRGVLPDFVAPGYSEWILSKDLR